MKHTILDLKKKVLVVEVTDNASLVREKERIVVYLKMEKLFEIEGNFKFICKCSELTEEIASGIVGIKRISSGVGIIYYDYKNKDKWLYGKLSALDSLKSAIEANDFFWLKHDLEYEISAPDIQEWQQAEEKTFRNCLIFEIL